MLEILSVDPGSIAAELDFEAGDSILSINDRPVRDLLDVEVASREEDLSIELQKRDGELCQLDFEKDADDCQVPAR
jgi:S1-C subfamily serine protease